MPDRIYTCDACELEFFSYEPYRTHLHETHWDVYHLQVDGTVYEIPRGGNGLYSCGAEGCTYQRKNPDLLRVHSRRCAAFLEAQWHDTLPWAIVKGSYERNGNLIQPCSRSQAVVGAERSKARAEARESARISSSVRSSADASQTDLRFAATVPARRSSLKGLLKGYCELSDEPEDDEDAQASLSDGGPGDFDNPREVQPPSGEGDHAQTSSSSILPADSRTSARPTFRPPSYSDIPVSSGADQRAPQAIEPPLERRTPTQFTSSSPLVPVAAPVPEALASWPTLSHDPTSKAFSVPPSAVCVTGLSSSTTVREIRLFFSSFGRIADFVLKLDPHLGESLGVCWIRFSEPDPGLSLVLRAHQIAGMAVRDANGSHVGQRPDVEERIVVELDEDGSLAEAAKTVKLAKAYESLRFSTLAPSSRHGLDSSSSGQRAKPDPHRLTTFFEPTHSTSRASPLLSPSSTFNKALAPWSESGYYKPAPAPAPYAPSWCPRPPRHMPPQPISSHPTQHNRISSPTFETSGPSFSLPAPSLKRPLERDPVDGMPEGDRRGAPRSRPSTSWFGWLFGGGV